MNVCMGVCMCVCVCVLCACACVCVCVCVLCVHVFSGKMGREGLRCVLNTTLL